MRYLYLLLITVFIFSCSHKYKNPRVEIQTELGDIEVELYPDQAPKTVAAFLSHIDSGYYKRCSFYRVLNTDNQSSDAPKAELIQGGIYKTPSAKFHPAFIPHETTQQTHIFHKDGTISMARNEPGTATSEFFICIGDQPGFDYGGENNADGQGYAAFGKVIKGMDVVQKIYNSREDNTSFDPPVMIMNIVRL
jgi:peptidyl-prolyl cis-trans isomerase A (cyclophilin A)